MDDSATESPPYISFRTFINFLERLESGGIPQRIDRSYWGGFLSGGYGSQVIATLRYFRLIDEHDEPTPLLEQLVQGDRNVELANILLTRYEPVIHGIDLSRATAGQLDQAFRQKHQLSGDTLRKARVFFVHAAQFAHIDLSSHLTSKTRTTVAGAKRNGKGVRRADSNILEPPPESALEPDTAGRSAGQPKDSETIELQSGGGEVTLSFSLNWFTAKKRERDFVLDLIDRLRGYAQGKPQTLNRVDNLPEPSSHDLPDDYYDQMEPPDAEDWSTE